MNSLENLEGIEPELLCGTPRKIRRRRWGSMLGGIYLRLFLLPFICAGVLVLLIALYCTALLLIGKQIPAQEQKRFFTHNNKGKHYYLKVTYKWAGQQYNYSFGVSYQDYEAFDKGKTVQMRLLPFLPQYGILITPNTGLIDWLPMLLFLWVFVFVWNSFVSIFVFIVYYDSYLCKQVVRNGLPARGRILDKQIKTNKSTEYYLQVEFTPNDGIMKQIEMSVDATSWGTAQIGDEETILYLPKDPNQNTIYKYADYEVCG